MSTVREDEQQGGTAPISTTEDGALYDKKLCHKQLEKKRKDKITNLIMKIGETLPDKPIKQSKNIILEKSLEYIMKLKHTNEKLLLEKCSEIQAEEISKLRKQLKEVQDKNVKYLQLLNRARIPNEEIWETCPNKYPHRATPEQASALLKRLENGNLSNGLINIKSLGYLQQNNNLKKLEAKVDNVELSTPVSCVEVTTAISSVASAGGTVMTQALPQLPLMSTHPPAPPPSIQVGGGAPSLFVINDNGIPILHNVVTFQNSPIILNSASPSPLLSSNFQTTDSSKDLTQQRIASAPIPTTGPSEVIIRPQSADTNIMKQVPGSSSSLTFSTTTLQPLLQGTSQIFPNHQNDPNSRMQLMTAGGMLGQPLTFTNQQHNSMYSINNGPTGFGQAGPQQSLPTALLLPNGQLIPVVSQPSLMYPNLTWTNKIPTAPVVKPPPSNNNLILPNPTTVRTNNDMLKTTTTVKKIMQKKTENENDRLLKMHNHKEIELCKIKIPLRNVKNVLPAPKKQVGKVAPKPMNNVSSQPSPIHQNPPELAPTIPIQVKIATPPSLNEPPPLIDSTLPPENISRPSTDILAQATESIFSTSELSPPTLTQEVNLDCNSLKEKPAEAPPKLSSENPEKSHDLLNSITVFASSMSTEELSYTDTITSSQPSLSENSGKENITEINCNKRFRPFSNTSENPGKRAKQNDTKDTNSSKNNENVINSFDKATSKTNLTKSPQTINSMNKQCYTTSSSLSVPSLLNSQKEFTNAPVSNEVITTSTLMMPTNSTDNYITSRDDHELPSLVLSSLTEDPSSLESGSNSGLPFLSLSPGEQFNTDISSKDLVPSNHHPFNFGSPQVCDSLSLSSKDDNSNKHLENLNNMNQKKKDTISTSPSNAYTPNSYTHVTPNENSLVRYSPANSTASSPQINNNNIYPQTTICQQFQNPQREDNVKMEMSRVSHNKPPCSVQQSAPSPSLNQSMCYSSSPIPRPTSGHSENSPCYPSQTYTQLKSPRNQLKPTSPAQNHPLTPQSMDKNHHGSSTMDNSFINSSSRSLEGSPSLSSYSAEALLSHQPSTPLSNSAKTACTQVSPVTTYPSNTAFPRGAPGRTSISYSAESLIQNPSCIDKKQSSANISFNYRQQQTSYNPPPQGIQPLTNEDRNQCPPPPPHSFVDTNQHMSTVNTSSYSNFGRINNNNTGHQGHLSNATHFQHQEQCRPFNRPSCTFPASCQSYSNLSFTFTNSAPNIRQQHSRPNSSTSCLQNFPSNEHNVNVQPHHQNGCLFPNQMSTSIHSAPPFSESLPLLHNANSFSHTPKYDMNKGTMLTNFTQPSSQNHIMNNFFPGNYVSNQRHENQTGNKQDHSTQDQNSAPNLNKIHSTSTKTSKSASKKSKQSNLTDNLNIPPLPFDSNRNNSGISSYFPMPDLSSRHEAPSFGNPRYFTPHQRPLVPPPNMLNDQTRMSHQPPRPPSDPVSYNHLFKPQSDPSALKFQSSGFGMHAPSAGGQPHVPNFNLSNIFPDISNTSTDALGFSTMKFHPPNTILAPPPGSQPPQVAMETNTHAPSRAAYHARPVIPNLLGHNPHGLDSRTMAAPPPFGPSHTHAPPSFGNMMPTLNFPLHDH